MDGLTTGAFVGGLDVPVPIVIDSIAEAAREVVDEKRAKWSYDEAFKRNRGLISEEEQQKLRNSRVAIAGMGGVGGVHLITLARLGIGKFTIADPDVFDVANFNRQYGATISNLGRNKAEAMAEAALDINPELELRVLKEAIDESNVDEFLKGADLYVDGLDFFAIDVRRLVFRSAAERGIWAVTAGPIGFSTAWLAFDPDGMSFDRYFDLSDSMERIDKLAAFAVGLTPKMLQVPYTDYSHTDLDAGTGPCTSIACELAAGVAGTLAIKLLLKRGRAAAAPEYLQFDAFRHRLTRGRLRLGNRSPLQTLKRRVLKKRVVTISGYKTKLSKKSTKVGAAKKGLLSQLPPIHKFLPLIAAQAFSRQTLERRPEPSAVTNQPENVLQYDQVMTTKLAIAYAVALEVIYRSRPVPFGGTALDLACGPGHFSLCMAKYLRLDWLTGIDLSTPMIEVASRNAELQRQDQCEFRVGDVTDQSCEAGVSVDLCTFTDAAHHLPDLATVGKVIAEMDRVTKPQGLIFLMDLVRLKNERITEKYVEVMARDYCNRELEAFKDDFCNSMYAAWTCEELTSSIPRNTSREWFICIPRGLPTIQVIVGQPPKNNKGVFARRGTPWGRSESPLGKALRAEWNLLRWMQCWHRL